MIKINRLTSDDIENILPDVRQTDVVECELMAGKSFEDIIRTAHQTTESYAASVNRRVIALFGVNVYQGQPLAWLVGTDAMTAKKYWRSIARISKRYVKYFIRKYGTLTNFVCLDNKKAVRFLQYLNARFDNIEYNIKDNKFKQFWLEG